MIIDFKIQEDEYGYYVVAYRNLGGVQLVFETNKTIASTLNLFEDEYKEFIHCEFGSDEVSKNQKMHFKDYEKAVACRDRLRDLIPKAIETGNLFLAQ